MTELRQKLHSRSGASMMLALLFLFCCLMVGAVALTAASASAGRTERNRRQQQDYLAVQSAARLLMDEMSDMKYQAAYTHRKITEYHTEYDSAGNAVGVYSETSYEYGKPFDSTLSGTEFQGLFGDYCKDLFYSAPALEGCRNRSPVVPGPSVHTLTLAPPEGDGRVFPAVEVSLTMGLPSPGVTAYSDDNYTVTAVLALAGAEADGGNRMTVTLRPTVVPNIARTFTPGNPEVETTVVTWTVTWEAAEVTKGGSV